MAARRTLQSKMVVPCFTSSKAISLMPIEKSVSGRHFDTFQARNGFEPFFQVELLQDSTMFAH